MKINKDETVKFIKNIKRPTTVQLIAWGIGFALAITLFLITRNLTACWKLTSLEGVPPQSCTKSGVINIPQPNSSGTNQPVAGTPSVDFTPTVGAPQVELPPPWDGASRVTVLIIGLDFRDWEAGIGAPRSDTLMVLTIDPQTKTAGMLSIPRDLWVNIPDFNYNRINTAYSLGESWKLPGGGPGLAVKTVEEFLGISIQYYAQIDFLTFERVIDEIGGVPITPFQTVTLDALGDGDIPVTVEAGKIVTLPGNLALAYARARHTKDGDIDRAKRQQEVILGIRKRVLDKVYWPMLVSKIYPVYQDVSEGINMNMTLEDALRLALLAREINLEEIKKGIIDYTMAVPITLNLPDGGGSADVLKPIPDKIRIMRDEIFNSGGALSPLAKGSLRKLMRNEKARVAVLNGSYAEGMAGRTTDYFKTQGMNVVSTENSSDKVAVTVLIDHSGKPYLLKYLMDIMNIGPSQVRTRFDPNSAIDVEIIIGDDWVNKNTMP